MEIITRFKNLAELTSTLPDDQSCREYLEEMRWHGKPVCPHCSHNEAYKFQGNAYYKCKRCLKKFTVTVGTVFEDTKIGLRKWFIAIYIFTSHKKGISSVQLSKDIGITQKSAWHMLHRIRHAFASAEPSMLRDEVEVDETYMGGKAKNMHKEDREKKIKGRGVSGKTPVVAIVERGGRVHAEPVKSTDAQTLQGQVRARVEQGSLVFTDDAPAYNGLDADYGHMVVNHSAGCYVDGIMTTNTAEGFFANLKRGIYGIYHHVSVKHLHRYCIEFDYRYNSRKSKEVARFNTLLTFSDGRLMYKTLIKKTGE